MRLVLHFYQLQHFGDTGIALLARFARGFKHEVEIVVNRAVAQELEILEHHSEAAAKVGQMLALEAQQVVAEHFGVARVADVLFLFRRQGQFAI